jgi:hypothetical protein
MVNKVSIVVTSIFPPNESMRTLAKGAGQNGWDFIIIGDSKSPADFFLDGAQFFSLNSQKQFDFSFAKVCPIGHYTRKNLGYLLAIKNGSNVIIETDDDNVPLADFWKSPEKIQGALEIQGKGWFNVYSLYSDNPIWPRGLPLESIKNSSRINISSTTIRLTSPIQQGLADGNPDVDAVFRMTNSLPLIFKKRVDPITLSKGLWSPFNSQNTTWFKEAFSLLYLPSHCTFRMTDIWRSFVAQRIAWECNWEISFHDSTVFQDRNHHNLLHDFEQEIPGYLLNDKIRKLLEDAPLRNGISNIEYNLQECYKILVKEKILTSDNELKLLDAWLKDVQKLI